MRRLSPAYQSTPCAPWRSKDREGRRSSLWLSPKCSPCAVQRCKRMVPAGSWRSGRHQVLSLERRRRLKTSLRVLPSRRDPSGDLPGQLPLPGFDAADLKRDSQGSTCPLCGKPATRQPNLLKKYDDRFVCYGCGLSWWSRRPKQARGAR
jgi:hypothetical protein